MGCSRQEYWRGWPCPPPGDLLDPEIKPRSPVAPASQADSLPQVPPGQPQHVIALSISLQKLPLKENKRWVSSEQEVFTTDHTGHLHLLCPPLKPRKWSLYCWEVQVTSLIWLNIPPIFPLTLIWETMGRGLSISVNAKMCESQSKRCQQSGLWQTDGS